MISVRTNPDGVTGEVLINGIVAFTFQANDGVVSGIKNGIITAPKLSGGQSGNAPIFGARAWVNFDALRNSSGGTDSANTARFIRASGNIASVVKSGTGDYRVTFTTPMDDVNYCVVSAGSGTADSIAANPVQGPAILNLTTTQFDVSCGSDTAVKTDWVRVCLAVFR